MASYNRVVLVGNLTRDPEYRQLNGSGQAVCRLGLAVNRQFKNKQSGSMVQEVLYIDIDVWGAQAESCRQYLQKGRPVLVEGRLKLDSWQDQAGNQRSKHSVVAERVVFMGTNVSAEASFEEENTENSNGLRASEVTLNPNNKVEKDLLDQLDRAEKKVKAAKAAAVKPKRSDDENYEVEFKDEPPFEDELPF
jgi:single-strand DNA-binding protein